MGQSGVTVNSCDGNSKMPGNHHVSSSLLCPVQHSSLIEFPKSLNPCPFRLRLHSQQIITYFIRNMDTVGWEHLCFLLPTPQNKPHFIHPFPLPSSHLERESSGSHAFCSISFLFPALSLQLLPPWCFLFSKYFSHLNFNFPSFPLLPIKYLERTVCIYSFTSLPSPPTSPKWFPSLLSHSSNAHFLIFS